MRKREDLYDHQDDNRDDEQKRAPVQPTRRLSRGPGTIDWSEHVEAWNKYHAKYHGSQSADRIAQRGGFDYAELVEFLGHEPRTWKPR